MQLKLPCGSVTNFLPFVVIDVSKELLLKVGPVGPSLRLFHISTAYHHYKQYLYCARVKGGGWAWTRGFPKGGCYHSRGGYVWFFQSNSTKREFESVWKELAEMKRRWMQLEQEWDATSSRVSKVLRRLARAEQAQDLAESGSDDKGSASLPLTSLPTPPDRLTRIRTQLATRGRKDGE